MPASVGASHKKKAASPDSFLSASRPRGWSDHPCCHPPMQLSTTRRSTTQPNEPPPPKSNGPNARTFTPHPVLLFWLPSSSRLCQSIVPVPIPAPSRKQSHPLPAMTSLRHRQSEQENKCNSHLHARITHSQPKFSLARKWEPERVQHDCNLCHVRILI